MELKFNNFDTTAQSLETVLKIVFVEKYIKNCKENWVDPNKVSKIVNEVVLSLLRPK